VELRTKNPAGHVVSHTVARSYGRQAHVRFYRAVRHHGSLFANLKSEICNMKLPLYTIGHILSDMRFTNSYVRNYKQNMQNKANFRKSQINVSDLTIREYELMDTWSSGKKQSQNKPNSNPNKANFKVLVISPVVKKGRIEYI
jgi:hypothetical protein